MPQLILTLRELNFTHDPSTGEVSYVVTFEQGKKTHRVQAAGRYTKVSDQPELTLTTEEDRPALDTFGTLAPVVALPRRVSVALEARFNLAKMVFEQIAETPLPDRWERVVKAAMTWRERIADHPNLWADREDLALIAAVDALEAEKG